MNQRNSSASALSHLLLVVTSITGLFASDATRVERFAQPPPDPTPAGSSFLRANGPAAGTIEGRVFNSQNGEYLENARVTVEGTTLEAFTDSDGNYRLTNVPAGTARVMTFYTGQPALTQNVTVLANRTARHDITLAAAGARGTGDVVQLDAFRVEASREMSGAALAINEQRFAPNIKTVVSTEEFGIVSEGNVGEFLKYLPGVTIDSGGGTARYISIDGVPPDNVPVTVGGFSLASSGNASTSRLVDIDMISINNASRVEVSFSPTAESPGGALAGSVNIQPRSAFERSKPLFNGSVQLTMRDDAREFHKVPGARREPMRNVHPGFDFSYIAPVNQRFGYTLSGGYSRQYSRQDQVTNTWRGVGTSTNGTTFPHTTPDRPYLSAFQFQDEPKVITRRSLGLTLDYKLTPNDRLSFSVQYSSFDVDLNLHFLTMNVGRVLPDDFTPFSTHGAPGSGSLQLNFNPRHRFNRTYMPTLTWRHAGPVWKAEAGVGLSNAYDKNNEDSPGFNTIVASRTGLTISFDDIFYLRPNRITVTDATGATVDPYALATYSIASGTKSPRTVRDVKRTAYANARRDFHGRVPFSLKSGIHLRESFRDLDSDTAAYSFAAAPDRSANAAPLLDPVFSQRTPGFGIPRTEWVSDEKFTAYVEANPTHFTLNENNLYRSFVAASKFAHELVSAAYLSGELSLLARRLKLVGGLRVEQTNIDAEGPFTDLTLNYRRDPVTGVVLRDSAGRPLPISTNALEVSQRTFLPRGTHAEKEYLRLFPSLNVSYNVRENLIARAAYSQSVGRPNFNQYSGGITLPDLELGPTPSNRITVNNAGIKAWSAQSVNARLEYYFEGVGQISIGGFYREFENLFGGTELVATPEFLALYGLDPDLYSEYRVVTQHNVQGTVRMTGFNVSYKQSLTFLPHWARGINVFANGSAQRATGAQLGAFSGSNYLPRSGSIGASLSREKFTLRTNLNYRGRNRRGAVAAGQSIGPGTYNWQGKRTAIDVIGEYRFRKNLAFFFHLRDVGAATEDRNIFNALTPEHAQLNVRRVYGSLWTFGLRTSF